MICCFLMHFRPLYRPIRFGWRGLAYLLRCDNVGITLAARSWWDGVNSLVNKEYSHIVTYQTLRLFPSALDHCQVSQKCTQGVPHTVVQMLASGRKLKAAIQSALCPLIANVRAGHPQVVSNGQPITRFCGRDTLDTLGIHSRLQRIGALWQGTWYSCRCTSFAAALSACRRPLWSRD